MPDTDVFPHVCAAHENMMSTNMFFKILSVIVVLLLTVTALIASAFAGAFASEDRVAALEKRQDLMDVRLSQRLDRMDQKLDTLLDRERQ